MDQQLGQTDELCYITRKRTKDGTFQSGVPTKTTRHEALDIKLYDQPRLTFILCNQNKNTENNNRDKRENH